VAVPDLAALARPASLGQVGGFRPSDDPVTSWAANVTVARPDEDWPLNEGDPMLALLQVVVEELPVVPDQLRAFATLTLFVGPFALPVDEPNGANWCLRTYATLDELAPLDPPPPARAGDPKLARGAPTAYRPFPVRWREVADWPSYESVPPDYRDAWDKAQGDETMARRTHEGLKVGGWPSTVQSGVAWSEGDERLDDVDFVLQVDSDEKTGFQVGYGGVLYIGRRRSTGTWHCSWQSM
jgi:Domain of unknown function (DUF1963)